MLLFFTLFCFVFLAVRQFKHCHPEDPLKFVRSCIRANWDLQCKRACTFKCFSSLPLMIGFQCKLPVDPVCCDLVCPKKR